MSSCPERSQTASAGSLLDFTLDQFIEQCGEASVRLHNGLRFAASENNLPYPSVRAYLQAGPERIDALLKLPALGRKSVHEFERLVHDAAIVHGCEREQREQTAQSGDGDQRTQEQYFNVSLADFLAQQMTVSTRLGRAILAAINDGVCPYATVNDYLADGARRMSRLASVPRLGATSVQEFEDLVQAALRRQDIVPVTIPDAFNISLASFLARQAVVSARLWRVIQTAEDVGGCPYATVADYIRDGLKRIDTLGALPSLGARSAHEFDALVQAALQRGTVEPSMTVTLNAEGFPDLELLVTSLLDSLDERMSNLLLDRLQAGGTLEAVAKEMGVTRERVRQIEMKAVSRLSTRLGPTLIAAFSAIEQQFHARGLRECSLHELAALATCDVVTCDVFFRFLNKLKIDVPASLQLCDGMHVICPDEFAPQNTWNEKIEQTLLNAQWPLVLEDCVTTLADVPRYYVEKRLKERYHATIGNGTFINQPRVNSAMMCLQVLTAAKKPLHLNDIRAGVFKHFGVDLTIQQVTSLIGRHPDITICDSGTYVRYVDLPYSSALIEQIQEAVCVELTQRQVFLSSKVLFERLFEPDINYYPSGFNHYFILGFCQDDPRFICKRGNMVGLAEFDLSTAYVSLEDEVRHIVLEHGPIDISSIVARLSETRKLCNDTGVRLILTNSPEVIQVGHRTYDALERFFSKREEYERLMLALKISLLDGAKSLYALSADMMTLGMQKASSEVVASILSADDDVTLRDDMYHLTSTDPVLQHYGQWSKACLAKGGHERLHRIVEDAYGSDTAERLVRCDHRFHQEEKPKQARDTGSELQSLLADFNL